MFLLGPPKQLSTPSYQSIRTGAPVNNELIQSSKTNIEPGRRQSVRRRQRRHNGRTSINNGDGWWYVCDGLHIRGWHTFPYITWIIAMPLSTGGPRVLYLYTSALPGATRGHSLIAGLVSLAVRVCTKYRWVRPNYRRSTPLFGLTGNTGGRPRLNELSEVVLPSCRPLLLLTYCRSNLHNIHTYVCGRGWMHCCPRWWFATVNGEAVLLHIVLSNKNGRTFLDR